MCASRSCAVPDFWPPCRVSAVWALRPASSGRAAPARAPRRSGPLPAFSGLGRVPAGLRRRASIAVAQPSRLSGSPRLTREGAAGR
eukprot:3014922-Pyramimonas_sp.AAC.1